MVMNKKLNEQIIKDAEQLFDIERKDGYPNKKTFHDYLIEVAYCYGYEKMGDIKKPEPVTEKQDPVTIALKGIPSEFVDSLFLFADDILRYSTERSYTIIQSQDTDNNYTVKVRLK